MISIYKVKLFDWVRPIFDLWRSRKHWM